MEPHGSNCGWFWAWTIAGFGRALGSLAIFGLGPLLLPFVTLIVGIALVAGAIAVVSAPPAPDTALAVYPIALVAFGLATAGRMDAEASGLIAGAALTGGMLGGPPALLLAAVAGVAAFPLLRRPMGAPLSR
jgi:hypothetical protein